MKRTFLVGATLATAMLLGSSLIAAELKSGPEEGSRRIPAFRPLHCNGPDSGGKVCLV